MPSESKVGDAKLAALERARISPRIIHACRKTGLLVDEEGYKRLCPKDRRAWDEALEEFDRLEAQAKSG